MKPTRRTIDPAMLTEAVMRRIWAKAAMAANGCIVWTGALAPNGYGRVGFGGPKATAVVHRLVYVWATGADIPPELPDIDHLCRNRACVNPTHLEAVTRRENIRRGIARGSDTIRLYELAGICAKGHDLTAPNAWRMRARSRVCRLCSNELQRQFRARKRVA